MAVILCVVANLESVPASTTSTGSQTHGLPGPRCPHLMGTRVPSGAVAHSRSVVYLDESKPPSTGATFLTALQAVGASRAARGKE